jgi:hypothetical protein
VPFHSPYADAGVNKIYNMLFCDELSLFATASSKGEPWETLVSQPPNTPRLQRLAQNEDAEARPRVLAYNRLRALNMPVERHKLFGVIVEAPQAQGLDTLAAFSDGGVRYINQIGSMSIIDPPSPLAPLIERLFMASEALITKIGPHSGERQPPPRPGNVRLSFLVSDGLYYGEGPMESLRVDAMGGPVIEAATQLLIKVVDFTINPDKHTA